MGELIVNIKPGTRKKYSIKKKQLDFEELERLILLAQARENLKQAVAIAKETGLSKISNKGINDIIAEVRRDAKAKNSR
jgi:hypothetical protein